MNVDIYTCMTCTQGVYSCFIKHLLRDHRQEHPQSSDSPLYIYGHITEDYDQETDQYPHFSGDNLFAHALDILSKIFRFTYSLSVRKTYPEEYTNLLVAFTLNDIATYVHVHKVSLKRLFRDHRQQHPQTSDSAIIRCTYARM